MGKNKLKHFDEIKSFHNVTEASEREWFTKDHAHKGNWHSQSFKNQNPIVLELGCGKGEYTVAMAKKFENKNFIGIDIKGARLWKGAKICLDENIQNVFFLRTRIDFINSFFGGNEVSEIWLTFSDPQPIESKARKRLTSPWFIERYKKLLKANGIIHVKTDSFILYDYTLKEIERNNYKLVFETDDLYSTINEFDENTRDILETKTYYEEKFLKIGKKIKYIKFSIE